MSYSFYILRTMDHTQAGGADSTNFVFPVSLTLAVLKSVAHGGHVQNANGFDIGIRSGDGSTPWNFQLRSYDATAGTVLLWAQCPMFSHTSDTTYRLTYGDPSITTDQSTTAVWSALAPIVVPHLDDPAAPASDVSGNGLSGAATGSPTFASAAIGILSSKAVAFTGSSYLDFGNTGLFDSATSLRVTVWIKTGTLAVSQRIVTKWTGALGTCAFLLSVDDASAADIEFAVTDGTLIDLFHTTATPLANTTVYKIDAVWVRGSRYEMYINGSPAASATVNVQNPTGVNPSGSSTAGLRVAADTGGSGVDWPGAVGEVRVSTVAPSAAWLLAEYNSQFTPATFSTGTAETAATAIDDDNGSVLSMLLNPPQSPPWITTVFM